MPYAMNNMMQMPFAGGTSGAAASPFRGRMQQAMQQSPQMQNFLQSMQDPRAQAAGQQFGSLMQGMPNYLQQHMQQGAQSMMQRPGFAVRSAQMPGIRGAY